MDSTKLMTFAADEKFLRSINDNMSNYNYTQLQTMIFYYIYLKLYLKQHK
jgi:hypothetical protein